MADEFSTYHAGLNAPASKAFAVTPNDSTDLTTHTRGLIVGVSGNVNAILVGDSSAVVLPNLAAGVVHPFRCKRILSTSTTATSIVGVL